jgi:hypothetical protein
MIFVESCADNAFPDSLPDLLYYEKSLFLRICTGQPLLKELFFNGYKDRLLNISQYGPQRFFVELLIIKLNIPIFLAKILFKIKFSAALLRMSFYWESKEVTGNLSSYKNLTFLMSDFERLTNRFTSVIRDAKNICEINSDNRVRLISNGSNSYFFLPRLTAYQFLSVLFAPAWKMTYLIRAYKQSNFIKKYSIGSVYIMDGDSPSTVSSSYAAYLASATSICIQWGAMVYGIKPGYKLFPCDYFLCTGQYYVDLLSPFSKKTKFLVSGFINDAKFDKKNDINRCKSILFLLEDTETVITKEESDLMVNLCIETKRRFPDLNITARPHPDMTIEEDFVVLFKKYGVVVDRTPTPRITLSLNKFVVGHASSLMIESVEYDCLPVFMEIGIKQLQPDLVALSAAMKFETKKEWFVLLNNLLNNYCNYEAEISLKNSLNNSY